MRKRFDPIVNKPARRNFILDKVVISEEEFNRSPFRFKINLDMESTETIFTVQIIYRTIIFTIHPHKVTLAIKSMFCKKFEIVMKTLKIHDRKLKKSLLKFQ